MASNIPVIVQGNSFSLAIPLQIYYINGDQMDLQDYTPDPTDDVTVQLKGSRRNYTYTPTIDGNIANIGLTGNELADNYSVVVSIVKANGQRLRSFRTDQFFIVESSDDLTTDDIIQGLEENVIYLNSSIFVAGEDGRGIVSIVKTSTSGLVDTYTITYTDATTSTFNVTNGAAGQQGADGVGITSIEKTATVGLVDTYTITLSNGQTSTFEVTNGQDAHDLGLAVIVNNLIDGGVDDALSAEMGKYLYESSSQNYIKGFYIDQTNKLVFKDTWNHYPDYIPCSQGDSLVWTPGVSLTLARLVFYNSSKEIVTSYTANSAQRTITAPANTAYVRVSFNDMYGDVPNTMPLKIGDVEYPRTEDKVGVKDIPITHMPNAIANNLYGYLYNHFGITDVPTDAMLYENKTIQGTSYYVTSSGTRCIAQLPIDFGYGFRVTPTSGYKISLFLCSYEQVGSQQIGANTVISKIDVTTAPITVIVPHGAHMAVIWVAKTTDAVITTDDAKLGFSAQVVKIPDVPRIVKSVNHRGYNSTHPENTLVAFQESRRQGFFCVETDVRTTSDGVLVLLHDASINRTARNADGTAISGTVNIADITYQQALEYDFGIAKGSQFAGTKIPTLEQFLSLCKKLGLHAYLENKDADVSAIVATVQNAGMRGNVTYLGGQSYLSSVKALDTKARLAMLSSNATLSLYNVLKNDYNEVIADMSFKDNYTTLKEAGIPVEVYVIDTTSYLDNMDSYISGVTSNTLVADRYLYLSNILEAQM